MQTTQKTWDISLVNHPPDIYEDLVSAFPQLCADPDPANSRSDLPAGWRAIAWTMCERLTAIQVSPGITIRITQIKEKWGTLRCYAYPFRGSESAIDATEFQAIRSILHDASAASKNTCLFCGASLADLHRFGGWVATACERHGAEGTIVPYL